MEGRAKSREPARIIGTGIEFMLEEEEDSLGEPRRADAEAIAVRAQEFVDFETGEGEMRWRGSSFGTTIDFSREPALALLDLVDDVRMNGPFGDLRRCDYDVTRWEYYSAPHRLVLSEKLRERLGGRI